MQGTHNHDVLELIKLMNNSDQTMNYDSNKEWIEKNNPQKDRYVPTINDYNHKRGPYVTIKKNSQSITLK
ncbi:MAG: hypothetical protein ABH828_06490 [archaeon]